MIDVFQYSNIYSALPSISRLYTDRALQAAVVKAVALRADTSLATASQTNVFDDMEDDQVDKSGDNDDDDDCKF